MIGYQPIMLIFMILTTTTMARSATSSFLQNLDNLTKPEDDLPSTDSQTIWNDLSSMYRIYQQCATESLSVCLKIKLLVNLERAIQHSKNLRISDELQFVSSGEGSTASSGRSSVFLDEKVVENELPRSADGKERSLNNMLFSKLTKFLEGHTLQIKFPNAQGDDVSPSESRKKKDKKGGGAYIMIPLLLGGTFIPIAYGALALLAGKALIVSNLALVLASIIGIKKLLGGGGNKESQHEVVVSSGGHSSGWGRDIDLAYSAYEPKPTKKPL